MFEQLSLQIKQQKFGSQVGRVVRYVGLIIEATGLNVFVGELCKIILERSDNEIEAEVVGINDNRVLLMPFGRVKGITLGSKVIATGNTVSVSVGSQCLGRVLDAFGNPLDFETLPTYEAKYPLLREVTNPLKRERITERLDTGIAAIDSLLTLGKGQRVGIMAGSGVGKSTLMGMLARNISTQINVIALIGERGREVLDFIEDSLGKEGLKRSVVVVATADQPPLMRTHAVYTALAISEFFCHHGKDVLFMMDSITRFAMAQREIGLAAGEPPTVKGYTPSVFTSLPGIVERAGNFKNKGSITGIFTVLVDGDDLTEPVTDAMRSILDGHIVLKRELANKGHYPPIDILSSISRLFDKLTSPTENKLLTTCRQILAEKKRLDDLIDIGAYEQGNNPKYDKVMAAADSLNKLMRQGIDSKINRGRLLSELKRVVDFYEKPV